MKKLVLVGFTAHVLASCTGKSPLGVTITNPLSMDRHGEMVAVPMAKVSAKLQLPDTAQVVVTDEHGQEVPSQMTYDDMLIFPVSVEGASTVTYTISEGMPLPVEVSACGRQYPERLDDVAWENDRAAYRAYGPALQKRGERAFGYDVWTKSVPDMVVEDRYDGDLNQGISYHVDHGNGMDCYAVGPTLGGGTAALFPDHTIVYPYCYKDCEILDNGPLRFTVRLVYNPLVVRGDSNVVETRVISLDKGSQLNKTVIVYDNLKEMVPVAAGIVLHKENAKGFSYNTDAGYIAYADSTENANNGNGVIYLGAVFPYRIEAEAQFFSDEERTERGGALGHVLGISDYEPGEKYVYYWGSGWSKYGFDTDTDWIKYLEDYGMKVRHPLQVVLE